MSWMLPSSSPRRMEKTRRSGKEVKTTWHAAPPFEEVWVLVSDLRTAPRGCFWPTVLPRVVAKRESRLNRILGLASTHSYRPRS
jgi:hypothetical protein